MNSLNPYPHFMGFLFALFSGPFSAPTHKGRLLTLALPAAADVP